MTPETMPCPLCKRPLALKKMKGRKFFQAWCKPCGAMFRTRAAQAPAPADAPPDAQPETKPDAQAPVTSYPAPAQTGREGEEADADAPPPSKPKDGPWWTQ